MTPVGSDTENRATVIVCIENKIVCTNMGHVRCIVHDDDETITYLGQRHYGGVRHVRHDSGTIDTFCALPGLRCMALVPREQRTSERHLVCCVAAAVYIVSRTGIVALLAGNRRCFGNTDARGSAARFSHIESCFFDTHGRLTVYERGFALRNVCMNTGFAQKTHLDDLPNLTGVYRTRVGMRSFIHVCTPPKSWIGSVPTWINKHIDMRDEVTGLLFENVGNFMVVITKREVFTLDSNNIKTILFDSSSRIEVPLPPTNLTGTVRPEKKRKPTYLSRFSCPTFVRDHSFVQTLRVYIRSTQIWPPGLPELLVDYARPGLSLLCFDAANDQLVSIPTNLNPIT
jgi:hypothetical protein